jgi:hypothetical protein
MIRFSEFKKIIKGFRFVPSVALVLSFYALKGSD